MGANIPYLKGVRTRYINILKKETFVGSDILELDPELEEEKELIPKISNCIKKFKVYSEKFETQTEKLAEAIGDKDTYLTAQLVLENEDVCDGAMECILKLEKFKEEFMLTKVQAVEERKGWEWITW